ncbi:hypothetical protein C9374_013296 [Naegleria lovaniensis]|uniref:IC97/Casc1 N-terminal domain-containing protein n=1 Tax=Naegleria lovaniensis TaxID=51637 RepID=A0AA88H2D8_NAELO|nr:uncharacterized protein C9374_013296 [Naegleria lovaniensis]KAG2391811.1 hypothetical protein C9374_013296 [Naegleria lovaniensis]
MPGSTKPTSSASPTKRMPSSSSASKPPSAKGEKMTAKQRKLLEQKKKEEEERAKKEEEEKRRKEEEEERKRQEEEERKLMEERRRRAEEERKRLNEEKGAFDSEVLPFHQDKLKSLLSVAKEEDEWKKFVECDNLPKLHDDVDMNNFVSSWRDINEMSRSKELRNLTEDFGLIKDGEKVYRELEYLFVESLARSNKSLQNHCQKYLTEISECILATLDDATAHIMQYFDKFLSSDHDQFQKVERGIQYGIWTNISKNLIRYVDFDKMRVNVELAIKGMGYQEIALRVVHLSEDIFSSTSPNIQEVTVLGGIYLIDFLHIPPLVHTCEDWKIRQITELSHHIKRKPYNVTNNENQEVEGPPPAKVTIPAPHGCLIRSEKPQVAWWNEKEKIWSRDGITNSTYEPETGLISFMTTHLTCPLAVVYENNLDKSFHKWALFPVPHIGKDICVFQATPKILEGSSSLDDIAILVHKDKCRLISPSKPELEKLAVTWSNPAKLLSDLAKAGINLIFRYEEDPSSTSSTIKSMEMEKNAYDGISLVCLITSVANSVWNYHPSVKREIGVMKVHKSLIDQSTLKPCEDIDELDLVEIRYENKFNADLDANWDLLKYQKEKCGFISNEQPVSTEEENSIVDLATVSGLSTHHNLFLALEERNQGTQLRQLLEESNVLTINSVKTILNLSRPLV